MNKTNPVIFILMACFMWSLDILARFYEASKVSHELAISLEYLFGSLFLVVIVLIKGRGNLFKIDRKDIKTFLFLGLGGSLVGTMLFTKGVLLLEPGTYSFIQILQPIVVAFLAAKVLKEKFDGLYSSWAMWCIFSFVLISFPSFLSMNYSFKGILMVLAAVLIWAICTVLGKKMLIKYSPLLLATWRWSIATLGGLIVLTFRSRDINLIQEVQNVHLLSFVFIGIICGALAMWIYYVGLKQIKASTVGFVELAYPAFGLILFSFYSLEKIEFVSILGLLSLGIAIAIIIKQDRT